ncbi:uncharacterized protein LOC120525763 isoform X1 [Polypterus senegalus]|uniref:uncharacterized protein LOC120525763 isoform X1 n=1 Tax=Polypterus senegalus TaxID=55291 RepID=UPI0019667E31|nr:uncharacterized protein LOC120525763 isoform X1 [Polypterus senegalus]XP_039604279.1 uncharacterized protein LOC120525763 isoform X1 [Polypterus senegalus]
MDHGDLPAGAFKAPVAVYCGSVPHVRSVYRTQRNGSIDSNLNLYANGWSEKDKELSLPQMQFSVSGLCNGYSQNLCIDKKSNKRRLSLIPIPVDPRLRRPLSQPDSRDVQKEIEMLESENRDLRTMVKKKETKLKSKDIPSTGYQTKSAQLSEIRLKTNHRAKQVSKINESTENKSRTLPQIQLNSKPIELHKEDSKATFPNEMGTKILHGSHIISKSTSPTEITTKYLKPMEISSKSLKSSLPNSKIFKSNLPILKPIQSTEFNSPSIHSCENGSKAFHHNSSGSKPCVPSKNGLGPVSTIKLSHDDGISSEEVISYSGGHKLKNKDSEKNTNPEDMHDELKVSLQSLRSSALRKKQSLCGVLLSQISKTEEKPVYDPKPLIQLQSSMDQRTDGTSLVEAEVPNSDLGSAILQCEVMPEGEMLENNEGHSEETNDKNITGSQPQSQEKISNIISKSAKEKLQQKWKKELERVQKEEDKCQPNIVSKSCTNLASKDHTEPSSSLTDGNINCKSESKENLDHPALYAQQTDCPEILEMQKHNSDENEADNSEVNMLISKSAQEKVRQRWRRELEQPWLDKEKGNTDQLTNDQDSNHPNDPQSMSSSDPTTDLQSQMSAKLSANSNVDSQPQHLPAITSNLQSDPLPDPETEESSELNQNEYISPIPISLPPSGLRLRRSSMGTVLRRRVSRSSLPSISSVNLMRRHSSVLPIASLIPDTEEEEEDSEGEETRPLTHPESSLTEALTLLKDNDWELKRKGLFTLRRLASWHSNILLPQLHDICLAVTQEVNNLRSKVARSAMRTLSEVFKAVGRNVDPEVEELTRVLLLKTGDTSEFLRDTAEKAMSILVENASPGRMLSALIATGAAQRNSIVRSCAAEHMLTTVESLGPERLLTGVRDGPDVILQTMVKLAQDGHQDTRFYGRRMLITFMAHPEFDRIIQRSLSTHDLHFVMTSIKQKGIRDSISEPPSAKVRHSFRGSFSASTLEATVPGRCEDPQLPIKSMRRRSSILKPNSDLRRTDADTLISPNGISARKQQDDIPQQNLLRQAVVRSMECTEKLKELQRLLTSREYQDRMHGVTLLLRISTDNTGLITANIQKILDWFIPRLQDSNKKVNLLALETASELVPLLADSLNPVLSGITTATIDNLNSKHPGISLGAANLLDALIMYLDNSLLLQPLASKVQFISGPAIQEVVQRLAIIAGTSYARKPQAVERYILPALWYLLANMTGNGILPGGCGNIRPVVLQLVLSLQQQMGSGLQESASSQTAHVQATLQELLKVEKPEEQCSSVET